ncbi:hypothetical protein HK097_008860 [Rhizophlyctis rosea]|uniref:Uncharacterized protein n=1 Tax=Rhizophlyctis rosea TaxID=64517 RepID=A0AAD5X0U3_9FUNG|nr:hypothetical protein HK097_008860 [Rhizophlyctis rosea]
MTTIHQKQIQFLRDQFVLVETLLETTPPNEEEERAALKAELKDLMDKLLNLEEGVPLKKPSANEKPLGNVKREEIDDDDTSLKRVTADEKMVDPGAVDLAAPSRPAKKEEALLDPLAVKREQVDQEVVPDSRSPTQSPLKRVFSQITGLFGSKSADEYPSKRQKLSDDDTADTEISTPKPAQTFSTSAIATGELMAPGPSSSSRRRNSLEMDDEALARWLQGEFDQEVQGPEGDEKRLTQLEEDAELARRLQEEMEEDEDDDDIIDLTADDEQLARQLQEQLNAEVDGMDVEPPAPPVAPPAVIPPIGHPEAAPARHEPIPVPTSAGLAAASGSAAVADRDRRFAQAQAAAALIPGNQAHSLTEGFALPESMDPRRPGSDALAAMRRLAAGVIDGVGWDPGFRPGTPPTNAAGLNQFRPASQMYNPDGAGWSPHHTRIAPPYIPVPGSAGPSSPAFMTPNREVDPADIAGPYLTQGESEEELKALLQHVQYDEDVTPPHQRLATPEGMTVNLLEHQKLGLEWMLKMERGDHKGGILADDMGMGKTVQSIATMVANPSNNPKRKSTLVVAPVSLIYQWHAEILAKVRPGKLTVTIYHGQQKKKSLVALAQYDVVLTSFSTLAGEWPETKKTRKSTGRVTGFFDPDFDSREAEEDNETNEPEDPKVTRMRAGNLFKMKWHRVILDEAHSIKNKATRSAKACFNLEATYRWCLTGTPIQNNIGDLFSLIHFLGLRPYCDWTAFRKRIQEPFKRGRHKRALERVITLMKAICLRRSKTATLDGKPIVTLPSRTVNMDITDFTIPEREFYSHLERKTQLRFNAYLKAGTVMKNYTHVLVLLLRLRQACDHPQLLAKDFEKAGREHEMEGGSAENAEDHMKNVLDNLKADIKKRLLDQDLNALECPVCLDTITNGVILNLCGHVYCQECLTAHANINPEMDARKQCPTCRQDIDLGSVIPVAKFASHFADEIAAKKAADNDGAVDTKGKGKAVDNGNPGDVEIQQELEDMMSDPDADWISSTKIDKMMAILEETRKNHPGEKTIIFSQFTGMLDMLDVPLTRNGYEYERYDGSMSAIQRDQAVKNLANKANKTVMLVSMKCGSLGLNLTCANHVILLDPWWNPAVENQSIDRVHRFGQQRDVTVHRIFIGNTVEDRIMQLQKEKQALADAALGEGEGAAGLGRGRLSLNDLVRLFAVDHDE